MKGLPFILASLLLPLAPAGAVTLPSIRIEGAIDPVMTEYMEENLRRAERQRSPALLVRLDTPGGLLDATRDIIARMLNSPVPVIVYVSPPGARATSAGVFIMMAADVAAMAPNTHLGAAHPVTLGGGGFSPDEGRDKSGRKPSGLVMEEKAVSDAAAYIRALARERGRNADWAERAVRESVSLTASEAAREKVIDLVAPDTPALLRSLDGKRLVKNGRPLTLRLAGASVQEAPLGAVQRFLHVLVNPNLVYLFMIIGLYALIYEFASPGVGFGAVVGIACLALAAYGMRLLPVNYAGVLLIGLGVAMMALDLVIASHGLLSAGGLALLVLGSLFLYGRARPYWRVSVPLIAGTAAASFGFFAFAVAKALEARRRPAVTGTEGLIGLTGEAREALAPSGMIYVEGELWQAESDAPASRGERVRVTGRRGPILLVTPIESKEERHD